MREESRCTFADTLHHAAREADAEARFREAEEINAKYQPETELLYSVRGFKYCDLLLTEAEITAWQSTLQLKTRKAERETAAASCRTVSLRARRRSRG